MFSGISICDNTDLIADGDIVVEFVPILEVPGVLQNIALKGDLHNLVPKHSRLGFNRFSESYFTVEPG